MPCDSLVFAKLPPDVRKVDTMSFFMSIIDFLNFCLLVSCVCDCTLVFPFPNPALPGVRLEDVETGLDTILSARWMNFGIHPLASP